MITSVPRRILAVTAAVVVVIVGLWYFAVWSPQAKNLKAANAAHVAAEAKISSLTSQISQLRVLVKEIPVDEAKLVVLQQNLPEAPQLDSVLLQLNQAAAATGVQLTSVAPSSVAGASGGATGGGGAASAAQGSVPSMSLSISTTGTPAQTTAFLTHMDQMQRTIVIDHISISGTSTVSAAIAARVFYAGQPTP